MSAEGRSARFPSVAVRCRFLQELAHQRPAVNVLYASSYTGDAIVRHGVLGVGVAFIQKPFAADALLRKLREVLEGRDDSGRQLTIADRHAVAKLRARRRFAPWPRDASAEFAG